MRSRIVHLATPRRIVATECCAAAAGAGVALLVLGAAPLAFALVAVCVLAMAPAVVMAGRLEKRGMRD